MRPDELGLFPERPVLSVSQLLTQIKFELEPEFQDIWVQGEISNVRRPPSGHIYFTLKDADGQLAAVCFRTHNRYLRFEPEDGMELLAHGSMSLYPPRGQLQIIVDHLEPRGARGTRRRC